MQFITVRHSIDIIDYVNRIGNYVRALRVIVYIRLSGVAYRKLAKKLPKIVTAAYLSNDKSKTKGVSMLNQAYSSEGVF